MVIDKPGEIALQAYYRPRVFQEVEALRFRDKRHMNAGRLSAVRTSSDYQPGNIPGSHFC